MVSCIRFKQRMRVDFPQPEGPMTAVTMWLSMSIVMSWMANFSPYQAESDSTRSFSAIAGSPRHGTEPDDDARGDAEPEHHEDEDRFPQRDGHQTQGLFRGPRHERDHDGR